MAKGKILIGVLVGVILLVGIVFAVDLSTFSDGSSSIDVTFTSGGYDNTTAGIELPKNATIFNATMNVTGEEGEEKGDDTEDAWTYEGPYDASNPPANAVDEDWNTYTRPDTSGDNLTIYENYTKPAYASTSSARVYHEKYGSYYLHCSNGSSTWSLIAAAYPQCSGLSASFWNIPSACLDGTVLQLRTILVYNDACQADQKQGRYYEAHVRWYRHPENVTIDIGMDGDFDFDARYGEFNTTNQTSDFASNIISYLSTCTADSDGNCTVPINVSSDTAGKVRLNNLNVSYNYTPTINSVTLDPTTPDFGSNLTVQVNATDAEDDWTECNYTLTSSNGTDVISSENMTNVSTDLFNSTTIYQIDRSGTWNYSIVCFDDFINDTTSSTGNFTITDSVNVSPSPITQTIPQGGTWTGNITVNTNSVEQLLFNFTTNWDQDYGANFTSVTYTPNPILANLTKNETVMNISVNSSAEGGTYYGNTTVTRELDGKTWNITLTITVVDPPPQITLIQPTNNTPLEAGTTSTSLKIETDENATCKYSTNSSFDFLDGSNMTSNGTNYNATITGLDDGKSYDYYFKCNDSYGNINPNSTWLHFSVANEQQQQGGGGGGGGGGGSSNYAPELDPISDQSATVGKLFTLTAHATDRDNDTLSYSDDTELFNIGTSSGGIRFTPKEEHAGEHNITITASDGKLNDSESFQLEVKEAPVVAVATTEEVESPEGLTGMITATSSNSIYAVIVGAVVLAGLVGVGYKTGKLPKIKVSRFKIPKLKISSKLIAGLRAGRKKLSSVSLPSIRLPKVRIRKPAGQVQKPALPTPAPQTYYPLQKPPMDITENMKAVLGALHAREREIMEAIIAQGGVTTQARIYHQTGIPTTTLSRWIDSLQKRDLVESWKTGKPRRIKLTEKFLKGA